MDVTLKILEPWRPLVMPGRRLSPFIGAVEALQLVGQATRPDLAALGNPDGLGKFRDGGIFWGGYGQRIHGMLEPVVRLLERDSDSRQAVLTIHDSKLDLGRTKLDIPCTLTVQFFIREDRGHGETLRMRVSMRSNDAWLGLPYDLQQFSSLQGAVAASLNCAMGTYTHTVGSMHVYDENREAAEQFLGSSVPDEPESETWPQDLWGPADIVDISAKARAILDGRDVTPTTDHELWLVEAMERVHGAK
jgi:thymidylate synthase